MISIKSRFKLIGNNTGAGSDRVLVLAPVLGTAGEDLQFMGASKANTLSIKTDPRTAAELGRGEFIITITPAPAG